jgi:hypothetical protein
MCTLISLHMQWLKKKAMAGNKNKGVAPAPLPLSCFDVCSYSSFINPVGSPKSATSQNISPRLLTKSHKFRLWPFISIYSVLQRTIFVWKVELPYGQTKTCFKSCIWPKSNKRIFSRPYQTSWTVPILR